jgi:hypothetical protein
MGDRPFFAVGGGENAPEFAEAAGFTDRRGRPLALKSWHDRFRDRLIPYSSGSPANMRDSRRSHQTNDAWLRALPSDSHCFTEFRNGKLQPYAQRMGSFADYPPDSMRGGRSVIHTHVIFDGVGALALMHADVMVVPLAQALSKDHCGTADARELVPWWCCHAGCPEAAAILSLDELLCSYRLGFGLHHSLQLPLMSYALCMYSGIKVARARAGGPLSLEWRFLNNLKNFFFHLYFALACTAKFRR